jgi:hypothetical protein
MNITPGSYDPEFKRYMDQLVEYQKKQPKRLVGTEQCESTKLALELQKTRPITEDSAWSLRPMNPAYLANPNAKTQDELVAKKNFDAAQVAIVEDIRHKARNTLGGPVVSSVTPETREKAIHAFQYTPAAELPPEQIELVTKLEAIVSYTPKEFTEAMNKKAIRDRWYKITPAEFALALSGLSVAGSIAASIYVWTHP